MQKILLWKTDTIYLSMCVCVFCNMNGSVLRALFRLFWCFLLSLFLPSSITHCKIGKIKKGERERERVKKTRTTHNAVLKVVFLSHYIACHGIGYIDLLKFYVNIMEILCEWVFYTLLKCELKIRNSHSSIYICLLLLFLIVLCT